MYLEAWGIILVAPVQGIPAVTDDLPVMGINIVIVLAVVLMVGGGDKDRIKINHIYPSPCR